MSLHPLGGTVIAVLVVCAGCRPFEAPISTPLARASASPSAILEDPYYLDEAHMAKRLSEPLSLPTHGDPAYFADRLARNLDDATRRCRRTIHHDEGTSSVEMKVELGCREASGHMRATFEGTNADRRLQLEFHDFWMNGHRLDGDWSLAATPAPPDATTGRSEGYVVTALTRPPYREPEALPLPAPGGTVPGSRAGAVAVALFEGFVWVIIQGAATGIELLDGR